MYGDQEMYQQSPYRSMFNEGGGGMTYIDFLPNLQKPSGIISSPVYDNFRSLMDRANECLRSHPEWDIVTCESIEFKTSRDQIRPEEMIYLEHGQIATWYIRGLRLWIKECSPGEERVKQVGYKNLVPEEKQSGGMFSSPVYETLDELIDRYNYSIRNEPIPGRIITIESQGMKSESSFDPDRSSWVERGRVMKRFLFIIRIFFEVSEPRYEEIGLTDFIPVKIYSGCVAACSVYEPLYDVVAKASEWCSHQRHLRICNIQTVATKLREALTSLEPETRKMNYSEWGRAATFFVHIVRVAHVKKEPYEGAEFNSSFTCKNFAPVQVISKRMDRLFTADCTMPRFETLQETMNRVSTWIKATGVNVINMETTAMRLKIQNGAEYSADLSFFYDPQNYNEFFIYVIKAYIQGHFYEPPEGALPPIPEIQTEGCSIL